MFCCCVLSSAVAALAVIAVFAVVACRYMVGGAGLEPAASWV